MDDMARWERGDLVRQVEVRTVDGRPFTYADVWQRRNLVLIALPSDGGDEHYVQELTNRHAAFRHLEGVCVITRDAVPGLPAPGALVTDRWGEVVEVVAAADVAGLPSPQTLLDWLEAVEQRCPECEGEAR